jgi:DNA polymerase III epsilon subunit-like protein
VSLNNLALAIGSVIDDDTSTSNNTAAPVVLVAHDIKQDLKFLQRCGFNPWQKAHIIDEVDTRCMFQRLERTLQGRSLSAVCGELEFSGHDFHNAGNDAYYTLRAMVVMAFKQIFEPYAVDSRKDG